MDDGPRVGACVVERLMQRHLLAGRIARNMGSVCIELRNPREINVSEMVIGRGHHHTIGQLHGHISRGSDTEPTFKEGAAKRRHLLTGPVLLVVHPRPSTVGNALAKKSGSPKSLDLSERATGASGRNVST